MKRVYLDVCALQRPHDDRSQPRVNDEAEAIMLFIENCQLGHVELISSVAIEFEIRRVKDKRRLEFALSLLRISSQIEPISPPVLSKVQDLCKAGLKALDALHIALASNANADLFCTCDDRLRRKMRALKFASLRVVSPIELIEELSI